MNKLQLFVISASVLLFLIIYFGFDTKPKKQALIEKARVLSSESTDISSILTSAKTELSDSESARLQILEQSIQAAQDDSTKIGLIQNLSGFWYDKGRAEIAGFYAEQIAEQTGEEEAWSIAGTTYAIGVQKATDEKIKSYCNGRAVKAFENAISINPSNTQHSINLALCYVENPPKDNPMKGIMLLLDLNKKDPDNASVLYNLGRLGNRTGQYEKSVQRLEKALALAPENIKISCQLALAYEGLNQASKALPHKQRCESLNQ